MPIARSGNWRNTSRPAPSSSYQTAFPATENPLSEGGIWLNGGTDGLDWTDLKTVSGGVYAAAFSSGTTDSTAQLKTSYLACTSNQYAEGTVQLNYTGSDPGAGSGSHEVAVFCNMTIGAHSITGYECYVSRFGSHSLVRWNGAQNNFTVLASNNVSSFTQPADGDVIRLENNAGSLACYQNGVLRTTATDTTYTGGNPGLAMNVTNANGTTLTGIGFRLWKGGNL